MEKYGAQNYIKKEREDREKNIKQSRIFSDC